MRARAALSIVTSVCAAFSATIVVEGCASRVRDWTLCTDTDPCMSGYACVQNHCVVTDGGDAGDDGRDASADRPECMLSTDCPNVARPVCSGAGVCVSCSAAGAGACAQRSAATPICSSTGACVECGADGDCREVTKPFCSDGGACVGCGMAPAGAGACATRSAAQPVCAPSGACAQCVSNGDCASTTPVCSGSSTCGPCSLDADCSGRSGPVVCMAHQDGRCAIDAETIYVQNLAGTCSDTGTGTAAAPFCQMQPAVAVAGVTRDLVVVRGNVNGATSAFSGATKQLTFVGQMSALVAGGVNPAFHVAAGDAYLRDLKLMTTASIGAQADSGSTLRLQHVVVNGNSGGGILLDGANFDIQNTTVTNNGPSTTGGTWGGILVNNPPSSGPKQFQLVTVQTNDGGGVSCSGMAQGSGVLSTGNTNTPVQISPSCGFLSCGTPGSNCGAQP